MSIRELLSSPSNFHLSPKDLPFSLPSFSLPHKSARPATLLLPPSLSLRSSSVFPIFPLTPKRPGFVVFQSATLLSEATDRTDEVQSGDEAPRKILVAHNVPRSSTAHDLRPLFEKYGTVVDIRFLIDKNKRNRCLAFVTMASHEEALAVLNNFQSYEFEGRILKLEWAKPKTKKPIPSLIVANSPFQARSEHLKQSGDEAPGNRVFALNIPWSSTADDFRPLFEKYGTVVDIEIMMYSKKRNKGLACVTMGSHEEALAVLTNLQSYEFEGRILKLEWAKSKTKKPIHSLIVANLPFRARYKDLKQLFRSGGFNVVSAVILVKQTPRRLPAGHGFVSFNSKEEAEAALSAFQGKEFMGRHIRVALGKSYLREQTEEDIQSQSVPSESDSVVDA